MDRKKLYRKRTMEEVAKRFSYTVDRASDSSEAPDPARQTVDTAIDTTRYAGRETAEVIKTYSRKLKDRPKSEEKKRSDSLKSESTRDSPRSPEPQRAESKKLQKEKIKKNYAKNAREAQKASKTAGKKSAEAGKKVAQDTESLVSAAMKKIAETIAEHPIGAMLGALIIIILLAFMCTLNSCGMIFGGVSGGSVSATYTAEDSDIRGAEADYVAKEAELQAKVTNAETLYPGYDEYRYDTDVVSHDPWALISALTVVHADFTRSQVQGTLTSLFNAQYRFQTSVQTEVRYRTESRTGYYLVQETDADGNVVNSYYQAYTYYVQVPYNYNILTVTLDNYGIEAAIGTLGLDADTMELYEYLKQTKGEKDYLF